MVKCKGCGMWKPLNEVDSGWCTPCRAQVERLLAQVFPQGVSL